MNIDLFTSEEVRKARDIQATAACWEINHTILNTVITDEVMARIDAETHQKNDRRYMAYRLQHIALRAQ